MKALTLILAILCAGPTLMAGEKKAESPPLAGWLGVFPEITGYQRTFFKPKAEDKTKYEQTARYEWTGGRLETVEMTLRRDPAFAKLTGPEIVGKGEAREVKVGKLVGWQQGKDKLVVILGADRILVVQSKTPEQHESNFIGLATKLPLEKCGQALDRPPRQDSSRNVDSFRQLTKGISFADVRAWVGEADEDIGSGIHIMRYALSDGSDVLLGFPDFNRLIYVKHRDAQGKTTDLVK